jgi:hypothetical protein
MEESKKVRNKIHFNGSSGEGVFKKAPLGHIKPTELDLARIVVHKKGLEIDGVNYICEISYNKKGFYITLFSIFQSQSVTLYLKYGEKTNSILTFFENDFNRIAKALRIKDGKIRITRPINN